MKTFRFLRPLLFLLLLSTSRLDAETTIGTLNTWRQNPGGGVGALGGNGVSAHGQTFVAPAEPVIHSFTLVVDEFDTTLPVRFRAYLAPWSTVVADPRPITPILYTSPIITSNGGADGWQEIRVETGGIVLEPGKTYVMFLGIYGLFQTIEHQLKVGYMGSQSNYSQGRFYFNDTNATGGTLENALSRDWKVLGSGPSGSDLAFSATFGPLVLNPAISISDGLLPTSPSLTNGQESPVDFGTAMPGIPIDRSFRITNGGNGSLTPAPPQLPPGFKVIGGFPQSIASGQSAVFTIRMVGEQEGEYAGILSIGNNSAENPFRFPLAGVVDGQGPVIANAKDIVANVDEGSLAAVSFAAITASDAVDGSVAVVCSPSDDAPFPPGVTPVTCTSVDRAGNQTVATFNLVVLEISTAPGQRFLEVVATNGEPLANAVDFGLPADSVLRLFNQASLNNDGEAIVEATVRSGTGDFTHVILSNSQGGFVPLAATGTLSPTGSPYSRFWNLAIAKDGEIAFQAGAGNTQVTVASASSLFTGGEAVGTGGAIYRYLHQPALLDAGHLVSPCHFVPATGSPVTDRFNDTGITSNTLGVLAREGDPSPIPGIDYGHFYSRIVGGGADRIAFACNLAPAPGAAIFAGRVGTLATVVQRGDSAPGTNSRFSSFQAEALNASGHLFFRATLEYGNGITTSNDSGLWSNRTGSLELVAREGEPAPCLPDSAQAQFGRFAEMTISNDGTLCFLAYLEGADVDSSSDGSLWRVSPAEGLRLIAREGDRANNTRARYATLRSFASNDTGGVAFISKLSGNTEISGSKFDLGVWIDNSPHLAPQLALRRGDTFELAPGDFRSVFAMSIDRQTNAFGGDGGYGRVFNDSGQALLRLTLSKGSSGVFLADLNPSEQNVGSPLSLRSTSDPQASGKVDSAHRKMPVPDSGSRPGLEQPQATRKPMNSKVEASLGRPSRTDDGGRVSAKASQGDSPPSPAPPRRSLATVDERPEASPQKRDGESSGE